MELEKAVIKEVEFGSIVVACSVAMWRFMKTHTSDVFNFDGDV